MGGISSAALVLVYWFWLQLVINLGWEGGGGDSCHAGA